jgi:hypothetical protein
MKERIYDGLLNPARFETQNRQFIQNFVAEGEQNPFITEVFKEDWLEILTEHCQSIGIEIGPLVSHINEYFQIHTKSNNLSSIVHLANLLEKATYKALVGQANYRYDLFRYILKANIGRLANNYPPKIWTYHSLNYPFRRFVRAFPFISRFTDEFRILFYSVVKKRKYSFTIPNKYENKCFTKEQLKIPLQSDVAGICSILAQMRSNFCTALGESGRKVLFDDKLVKTTEGKERVIEFKELYHEILKLALDTPVSFKNLPRSIILKLQIYRIYGKAVKNSQYEPKKSLNTLQRDIDRFKILMRTY